MPTLNWIGKEAVVNHDKEVPFRLLKKVKSASVGNSQNLILHGDNLQALKALMPYYTGKVKCIYIDPPYNTGSEQWVYNDKVNSPKIRKWLGKVVGRESEDLCRHDKWLCMMYPRLKLLRELLREDGLIFISIDDNEASTLKLLCDEIFGEENFLYPFYYQVRYPGKTLVEDSDFQIIIETALVYRKSPKATLIKQKIDYSLDKFIWKIEEINEPKFVNLGGKKVAIFQKDDYKIVKGEPSEKGLKEIWATGKVLDINSSGRFFRDHLAGRYKADGLGVLYKVYGIGNDQFDYRYFTGPKRDGATKGKYYQGVPSRVLENPDDNERFAPIVNFENFADSFGNCRHEGGVDFRSGKKPIAFLKHLLKVATSGEDEIILDSFAGSGSTGHAVLDLNKEDGGTRKFILIEMEDHIAKDITATRIKNAIQKNKYDDGFEYCELSKPLFDEEGQIEDTCDFDQFATYIYFTETQTNIDPAKVSGNYIGEYAETEYYLIYKEKGENVLSKSFLKKLRKTDGTKVIYADKCLLDEATLAKHSIIFKQIPYEVKVY
ncbi:site-specific DNA-methyltransferase [Candidatus Uhrbacteria bacterium]|nr:site-specific DNA-methyltransferase [Candidatus Uhrbacteria bacterium]